MIIVGSWFSHYCESLHHLYDPTLLMSSSEYYAVVYCHDIAGVSARCLSSAGPVGPVQEDLRI